MPRVHRLATVLLACVGIVMTLSVPAAAADGANAEVVVRIRHAAVTPIHVSGTGIGSVRTFFVPTSVNGRAAPGDYLTGTLTTVAVDAERGTELRTANLVFVVGRQANQLVVGGVSTYPATSATLPVDHPAVRPVIGGSGRYDGARGYVVSTNLGEKGWLHVFHVRQ